VSTIWFCERKRFSAKSFPLGYSIRGVGYTRWEKKSAADSQLDQPFGAKGPRNEKNSTGGHITWAAAAQHDVVPDGPEE